MDFLLLAIGNPGDRYKNTRHNLGVLVLWELIKLYDSTFNPMGNEYQFLYKGNKIIAQWTISYVNTTGNPLLKYMNFHKILPNNLMVFWDNLDNDFGQWKYTYGFGTNGHNGLKSIKNSLGSPSYHRISLGISRPINQEISQYVLENIPNHQLKEIYNIAHELYSNNILDKLILQST